MTPMKTGIIGCGNISPAYLKNIKEHLGAYVEAVACADLNMDLAKNRAEEFQVARACSVEDLLADGEVSCVVNLTNPPAHHPVSLAALEAGKHVFTEKPLAVELSQGRELLDKARSKGLKLAGAADTFLGAGLQLCRKVLDEGRIGEPLNATAYVSISTDFERYHRKGYGPMFDLGPYYITALLHLLGPVASVSGMARIPFPQKSQKTRDGKDLQYKVETPTDVVGLMKFESGPHAVITASSEVSGYYPRTEIFGTEGVLVCNDANGYGGDVWGGKVLVRGRKSEEELIPSEGFTQKGRALGVAELARAIDRGTEPLAGADMLYHVLEIMHGFHSSSEEGREIPIKSRWGRPVLMDPL